MAKRPLTPRERRANEGFDVTCVIGRVEFGRGEDSPTVAAFRMIAEHDAPGTYTFPLETGGVHRVTVEHERDDPNDELL